MPLEDSLYPAEWTRIAEKDLIRAQKLLADEVKITEEDVQDAMQQVLPLIKKIRKLLQ